jgi:hypothetical protein
VVLGIYEQALLVEATLKFVEGRWCRLENFYKWVLQLFDGRLVWFYQMDVKEVRVNGLEIDLWKRKHPLDHPDLSVTLGLVDEANEHEYCAPVAQLD